MASQIAQSIFTRASPCIVSRNRASICHGRAPVAATLKLQSSKCAAMKLESSSSLMGASLWRTLGSPVDVKSGSGRRGGALGTSASIYVGGYGISPETVRWCVAAACTVLLLKHDAGAKKQFWAGILALEAPRDVVYWAKSEYGLWVASIGLALKLFYHVPAELDYPLAVYLLIVSLPAQAVSVRGTTGATVVSAALALFVAYQYFSNTVKFSDAFKGEHLINTILISLTAVACVWFFGITVL